MKTQSTYLDFDDKTAILALWYIVNTSLSAFTKLTTHFGDAKQALIAELSQWQALGLHQKHLARWQDGTDVLAFVEKIYHGQTIGNFGLVFLGEKTYPKQLLDIYDPPPMLFYQGNVKRLFDKQIAIVGSRKPTPHAEKTTFDIAQYLVYFGLTITSGLAGGIDKMAHLGALSQPDTQQGRTIGVLGTGIDVCYPKNHHALYAQIINEGGCLVSELLPTTPASKHTFPRRNRLVAGLSMATLVVEAAMQSGSLITARLTAEQGKQVFCVPSLIDNINAQGCHHLIREGATLIYHPEQILEDLSVLDKTLTPLKSDIAKNPENTTIKNQIYQPTTRQNTAVKELEIAQHLQVVWENLSSIPCDLDNLVLATNLDTASLLANLLELEILGLIHTVGGRYARLS